MAADEVSFAAKRLGNYLDLLSGDQPLDSLRGCEGDAAHIYFGVFDHLIVAQKETLYFLERNRRSPLDNVNALLSFIYTLLVHDIRSALEVVGLDPAVGFLHRDRPAAGKIQIRS
jgi:CRISP-associated protein Cas1